jgi:hypothetical protein
VLLSTSEMRRGNGHGPSSSLFTAVVETQGTKADCQASSTTRSREKRKKAPPWAWWLTEEWCYGIPHIWHGRGGVGGHITDGEVHDVGEEGAEVTPSVMVLQFSTAR